MVNQPEATPRYHALLIGIDDYKHHRLRGCVNDIDEVQRILLSPRVRLPADRITRLASPHPGEQHDTTVPDRPATLANIRSALAALGSEAVAPGDRVFIYYSGHGARVEVAAPNGQRFHREAIVPVDFAKDPDAPPLLFDHELNQLLRAITQRTRAVTMVLDCCHAAGATRNASGPSDDQPRFIDLASVLRRWWPLRDTAEVTGRSATGRDGLDRRLARGVDDCQVIAACLDHEVAHEQREDGVYHGVLTRAFIAALGGVSEPDLTMLTWARIWQALRAEVQCRNPWQNPWAADTLGRAVFAGPALSGDPGIPVTRDDRGYRIEAGTLADVTIGTRLAIYGEQPPDFPPLGTPEDLRARLGVLRVTSAGQDCATATGERTQLELPSGARARIIQLGESPRLRYAIIPPNAALDRALAASPLLERAVPPAQPDVRLELSDGQWFVTDSVQGRADEELTLFALQPSELDCARAVLEHYHAYARPLRMAAAAGDLPGGLMLRVLSCPNDRKLGPAEAQGANLPEAPSRTAGTYALDSTIGVCFQVHNRSPHPLRVSLLNSAASGKVQFLGDQVIDARAHYIFWARNELGMPFRMVPPAGRIRCADRLVAIGRTAVRVDLGHLRLDKSFADVIRRYRDAEFDKDPKEGSDPLSYWTAAQAVIITSSASRTG